MGDDEKDGRGVRCVRIAPALLIEMCKTGYRADFICQEGLPADAAFFGMSCDPYTGLIEIAVRSAEFPALSAPDGAYPVCAVIFAREEPAEARPA